MYREDILESIKYFKVLCNNINKINNVVEMSVIFN